MITDKSHSIEIRWIKKIVIIMSPFLTLCLAFFLGGVFSMITDIFITSQAVSYNFKIFAALFLVGIIINPILIYAYLILLRKNFNYELGEEFIIFQQGIISKSERTVPYGRIQHIVISQGPIDKRMGLASIIIETGSEGGGVKLGQEGNPHPLLGFASNAIRIPGLLYGNAVEFKRVLMESMKKNPIDDAQSGL